MIRTVLTTPPLPLLVPEGVFDAFGWCASDTLVWMRPEAGFDAGTPLDGSNPARMVFVLHAPCSFLPLELASLHATGMGFTDEWALAPYGIDDATDGLYEHEVAPKSVLSLAADNLNAIVWGLHDWAHFHNHGPFESRAWTELQCDSAALSWLAQNRAAIGLSRETLDRVKRELALLSRGRFQAEGVDGAPIEETLARCAAW